MRCEHLAGIDTNGSIEMLYVAGTDPAVYSCTKPFNLTKPGDYEEWLANEELRARSFTVANKLAWRANGENKFLRMIMAYMEIRAPRAWWSHFDTYKVGTVAQSESTMHSLAKRLMTKEDCEIGTSPTAIDVFNDLLVHEASINELKYNLPEGFLQSRVVAVSYATLQTMWYQRHVQERLGWWKIFLGAYPALPHSSWLFKYDDSMKSRFRQ